LVYSERIHTTSSQSLKRDKIDLKIVGLLFEDARRNFSEIGNEVGLSKNAVWSRFKKMTKSGIITGATVQINYKKLGYDAVGTLLMDVEPSQIEQVSKYIKTKIPDVFGPFPSASRYNLRAVVTLKTISELGSIKEDLRRKLAVTEINSSLWTDVWFTPENLSLIPIRPVEFMNKKSTENSTFDADEIDLQIIRELAKDCRISFRTIAKQLEISIDTVARRYEKLKENGIIVPRIQIDPTKIGYSAIAHFYLRVLPKYEVNAIISKIISTPDLFYVMKCTGDYNVGLMFMVKCIEDMLRAGDCLTNIEGIKRIETVTNTISGKWPLPRTYTSTLGRESI
jgi:Lrp/AsnC family leucine-responsive transcriptional regulator